MKWIVLDFGTKKIKALKVQLDGQKLVLEDFHSFDSKPEYFRGLGFPDVGAWAAATIALNEIDWLKPEEEHVVISALPSAYLETRYIKFPFKSEKQIEKVLPFELEAAIPFDIEEIQIRNQILEGDGISPMKKEALVLALAYKRSSIKNFEGELRKFQLSNPPITAQILALTALKQAVPSTPIYGILEVGHSKSELLILSQMGGLLGLKTFWWGGKNLIQAVQEELSTDEVKAEHVLSHMDPEKPLTKGMAVAAKSLVTEVRQTLKGFLTAGLQLPKPLPVYTFGRPTKNLALLAQLEEGLKSEFGLTFSPFPFPNLKGRNIQGLERIMDLESALPAISIALSQTRVHRNKIPSFSETGFQFQQNLKKLKTGSFSILKKVAMLLIAPLIYAFLQYGVQRKENQVLLSTLPQILRGTAYESSVNLSTDEIVLQLKKDLSANRSKIAQLQENDKSPLIVLTQISKALPSYIKIDVKDFKVTEASILVAAETNSIDSSQKLIDSLKVAYPSIKAGATTNCAGNGKTECKAFTVEVTRETSK